MPQVPCVSRYLVYYLVAPYFRSKDPRVSLRTDTFFAKALDTLADVDDKNLSAYLHRNTTAWYLLFPPVHTPDRIDDTQKVKDHEGPEGADASNVEDMAASHPILSEDEDASDKGA